MLAIDGHLSEETWAVAPAIGDLLQRNPNEGQPATERSDVRLAYDDQALYVGARLFDRRPDAIVRRLSRRDGDSTSDFFRVYLDPHHDHLTNCNKT